MKPKTIQDVIDAYWIDNVSLIEGIRHKERGIDRTATDPIPIGTHRQQTISTYLRARTNVLAGIPLVSRSSN